MDKKLFKNTLARFDSELWHFHVIVPIEVVDYFHSKDIKRFVCKINGQKQIHCAFMPAGEGYYFININKEVRKALDLNVGDSMQCEVWEDDSDYGVPMPDEFREVLDTDPIGDRFFHALTPGKQRSLIYLVSKLKSQDKRIVKALIILDHLSANEGKLDFKMLNEAFKLGRR